MTPALLEEGKQGHRMHQAGDGDRAVLLSQQGSAFHRGRGDAASQQLRKAGQEQAEVAHASRDIVFCKLHARGLPVV